MTRLDDELTPEERAALGRLPRDAMPRAGLERETVAALSQRGLLRRRGNRWNLVLALAAAAVLFVGGIAVGRMSRDAASAGEERQRFMLLLYEGPEYQQPTTMGERVREYSAWARQERRDGAVEGGEKLRDGDDIAVGPDGSGETRLAGYFLIRAADRASALAIARTCPHAKYGGRIVIREIEPT